MTRWAVRLLVALLGVLGAAVTHADERRIPLANLLDGVEQVELQGEADSLALTAVLPPMAPLGGAVLTLRYENSVDVLPERSRLVVTINDQPVAELPMTAFRTGPVSASISLPPDRLRIGDNRIVITQEAQNRAVCTPRGTYDLWTRLHLVQSMLTLKTEREMPAPDLAQLRVLMAASDRVEQPLTILRSGQAMSQDHLGWGVLIAQAYGRMLEGRSTRVDSGFVRDTADVRAAGAKAVLVGTRAEIGDLLPADLSRRITGPFLGIQPSGTVPGGFLLVVSGRTPDEVDTAALRLSDFDQPLPPDTAAVVEKGRSTPLSPAGAVMRAGRTTLGALGFQTVIHAGYRYQDSVGVRLPADFRPVTDRAILLHVDGAFDGDFGHGTLLNVRVNGKPAGTIDLDRRSTPKLERAEVRLPMQLFRAGDNSISFEAILTPVADGDCLRSTRRPSFTLRDSTELEIPSFARAADMPDLGSTARTAFPYYRPLFPDQKGAFDLIVVGEEEEWKSAALTLVARLSQGSEGLLRPVPVLGWHDPGDRNALIVGPVARLPATALAAGGIPPGWLASVVEAGTRMQQAAISGNDMPEVDRRRVIQNLISDVTPVRRISPGPAGDLPANETRWEAKAPANELDGWVDRARRAVRWLEANVAESDPAIREARIADTLSGLGADGRLPDTVLLQFEGVPDTRATWTVLAGADAAATEKAAWALTGTPRWSKLSGATVLWRAGGGEALTLPAMSSYAVIGDPTDIGNLFLIGATYLSHRIGLLFGLLLVLVTVLATSLHFLLRAGRHKG